jgi:protein-arginine kinase activator protein McsA
MSVHHKYISKVQPTKCNISSIYLFLQIFLHVSSGSSAHHQEHKTVHTASGIVKPILLSAALVDEKELRSCWMCTGVTRGFAGVKLSGCLKMYGSFRVNFVNIIIANTKPKMSFNVK